MTVSTSLFLVGVAVLLIPPLLQRFQIDVRGGEVIVGILIAFFVPETLDAAWVSFLAKIGLLVLMFEIGLDIDLDRVKDDPWPSLTWGLLSFAGPAIVGGVVSFFYVGSVVPAFIIGVGLASTSLAVVIPSMRRLGIDDPLVKNAAMVSEMIGITVLMAFARSQSLSSSSLLLEAASVLFFVGFAVYLVPRFLDHVQFLRKKTFITFETKFMLFVLLVVSLVSEELGVHAATGSFLAGLFLSESTHQGLQIEERLKPILELLVPVFFVHIGYLVDPSLITWYTVWVAVGIAGVVYVARLAAFYSFDELTSFSFDYDKITLFAPCMTITATAAEIGLSASLFSAETFSTFIIAGLILTVIGPLGLWAHRLLRS